MSKVRTPTKSAARRKCTHYTIAARLPLVERRVCERQRAEPVVIYGLRVCCAHPHQQRTRSRRAVASGRLGAGVKIVLPAAVLLSGPSEPLWVA